MITRERVDWARPSVVVAILGLSAAVGLASPHFEQLRISWPLVIAAAGGLFAVGASLINLGYGVLLLPVAATATPFVVGTGTGSPVVAALLLVGFVAGLWLATVLIRRRLAFVSSPTDLPLLGFVLVAILATVNSNVVMDPLVYVWPTFNLVQLGALGVVTASALAMWATTNHLRSLPSIQLLTFGFLGLGAAAILGYFLLGRDLPGFSVGGMFSTWVIALALGQAVFNERLPRWGRAGLVLLAAAWLYRRFFFESFWLSGWVPALVAIAAVSLLKSRRQALITAAAVAMVGLAGLDHVTAVYDNQVHGSERAGNFARLDVWSQNLDVTRDHVLLGTGMAGYAPYYMTYLPDRALSSHSNYFDIFAQTGLVGTAFFAWFILATLRVGRRARRRWTSGFAAGFVNGVLGGFIALLVAMMLGDWLIPFAYNQTIAGFRYTVHSWIFLGALAGMLRMKTE